MYLFACLVQVFVSPSHGIVKKNLLIGDMSADPADGEGMSANFGEIVVLFCKAVKSPRTGKKRLI